MHHVIEIVYAVPNDASDTLINTHQTHGRMVLVDRGGNIPIVQKVVRVQEAGGIGVIVVDHGECAQGFHCPRLGHPSRNGLLDKDDWARWRDVTIPMVLILKDDGERIKQTLDLIMLEIPDVGPQYVLRE
jgi:hypothetical protein